MLGIADLFITFFCICMIKISPLAKNKPAEISKHVGLGATESSLAPEAPRPGRMRSAESLFVVASLLFWPRPLYSFLQNSLLFSRRLSSSLLFQLFLFSISRSFSDHHMVSPLNISKTFSFFLVGVGGGVIGWGWMDEWSLFASLLF